MLLRCVMMHPLMFLPNVLMTILLDSKGTVSMHNDLCITSSSLSIDYDSPTDEKGESSESDCWLWLAPSPTFTHSWGAFSSLLLSHDLLQVFFPCDFDPHFPQKWPKPHLSSCRWHPPSRLYLKQACFPSWVIALNLHPVDVELELWPPRFCLMFWAL